MLSEIATSIGLEQEFASVNNIIQNDTSSPIAETSSKKTKYDDSEQHKSDSSENNTGKTPIQIQNPVNGKVYFNINTSSH